MHYSGSTVFKITSAVSNFLQKRKLNDSDQKALDLIFNFYKIPKEYLYQFTEPISVLDYFSDIILKDLRNIEVSCDYDTYFNTNNQWYQEFVRSVFDVYTEKRFITTYNNSKSLNYSDSLFRNLAVKRLNETEFSPPSAKVMVGESLEKLNDEWSFERINSIGTEINN
jgi:leucyl-tRNA synthetase